MMSYDKEPMGTAQLSELRAMFAGQGMNYLRRAIESDMQAHYIDSVNLHSRAAIENSEKFKLAGEAENKKATELAAFLRTLDTVMGAGYDFFTIRIKQ